MNLLRTFLSPACRVATKKQKYDGKRKIVLFLLQAYYICSLRRTVQNEREKNKSILFVQPDTKGLVVVSFCYSGGGKKHVFAKISRQFRRKNVQSGKQTLFFLPGRLSPRPPQANPPSIGPSAQRTSGADVTQTKWGEREFISGGGGTIAGKTVLSPRRPVLVLTVTYELERNREKRHPPTHPPSLRRPPNASRCHVTFLLRPRKIPGIRHRLVYDRSEKKDAGLKNCDAALVVSFWVRSISRGALDIGRGHSHQRPGKGGGNLETPTLLKKTEGREGGRRCRRVTGACPEERGTHLGGWGKSG